MENVTRKKFLKTFASILATGSLLAACGEATTLPNAIEPDPSTKPATTGLVVQTASPVSSPVVTTTGNGLSTTTSPGTATSSPTGGPTANFTPAQTVTNPPAPTTRAPAPLPQLSEMDLAAKVGQRMLVVFEGEALTPAIANFLLTVKPGGIVLFAGNITSLAQVKGLNNDLQALAAKNGLPPFIITVDEEGGIVSRMPPEGRETVAPSQMAQAAAGLVAIRNCAHETAIRLSNLGFNLNLAPVADVNSNYQNPVIGTRSFGSDPILVGQAVRAALMEYQAQGLGACAKHFPGHGDTTVDSHIGLPIVRKARTGPNGLNQLELVPFKEAIGAGTPAIMVGHILFPQIEPEGLPASLSPYFLKQVLRDELKFEGLIITDSLSMGAISGKYGLAEASSRALKAGADMIIAISDLAGQVAVFQNLLAAARRNEFEVDRPAGRILAFKGAYAHPLQQSNRPETPASITTAAQDSITLLRDDTKVLPIRGDNPVVLVNFALANPSQVEGQVPTTLLGEIWKAYFKSPGQPVIEVSTSPTPAEVARVTREVGRVGQLVLVTRDAFNNDIQASLVRTLLSLDLPTLIVAVRSPYDLAAFPQAQNYLTSYSDTPASLRALLRALTGASPVKGKLPVSIPHLYEVGAGLIR